MLGAVEVDVNRVPEAVVQRLCPAWGLAVVYNEGGLRMWGLFARAMGPELRINGKTIHLSAPSDVAVAQRVAGHMQRGSKKTIGGPTRTRQKPWLPGQNSAESE